MRDRVGGRESTELAEAYEELRPRLFGIAYRMLGTRAEAEDAVQEAWLRLERARGVDSLEAFLTTTVTRICIDHLRSARVRRERYVGPWLPEPLLTSEPEAEEQVERAEALSLAVLRVLDRLEPLERAVFLLREVFAYPYEEVARVVGRREDHCRQIALRARQRVRAERPRVEAAPDEHARLLKGFLRASAAGDMTALESILREDVVLVSDGGGKAVAARNPIRGVDAVSRFMVGISLKMPQGLRLVWARLNGFPGAVLFDGARARTAISLDVRDGRVAEVLIMRNPDKLASLESALSERAARAD